jgi:hypothetical protein
VRARPEAARLRCGLPLASVGRMAGLQGMSVCRILNAARHKAALAGRSESRRTAAGSDGSQVRQAEKEEGEIG